MMTGFVRIGTLAGALCLLGIVGAQAADLGAPRYKTAPIYTAPAPAATWTGFYIGVNGGYGFGKNDVTLAPTSANFNGAFSSGDVPGSASVDSKGWLGGGTLGYNWQMGSWLAGLEADFDYSAIKGDATVNAGPAGIFVPSVTTLEHKMDWFGTARLRLGYVPWNPMLLYATGGLAVGHVKDSATIAFPSLAQSYSGESSATKWGWTAGAGAEFAFYSNWSAKVEYLYYDLGSHTVDMTVVSGPVGTASADFPAKGHQVRLGVNYRF